LAAVHRSRLFAMHLPAFNWLPIILAVNEKFYEEALDHNLKAMLPKDLRIEKVNAFPVTKPRVIGDTGLRAFFQLYSRAKKIIRDEKIDFLLIPIPSFYISLLGRWLHATTHVPYGIDYIDPWVHEFKGSDKVFSRPWWSTKISRLLEPIAVKKAVLITGVAEGYYEGVKDRNPHLNKQAIFAAMPYGGEKSDHEQVQYLSVKPYLFSKKQGKMQLVYAGAMLPKAYKLLEAMFESIAVNGEKFKSIEFHFVGTGKTPNDPNGFSIKPVAEKYGLWQTVVYEYPKRIPYLDVLIHLEAAEAIFVLGSTESHYTPSKVYQGVLSGKPVFAILHQESSAAQVLANSKAGKVLTIDGEREVSKVKQHFSIDFIQFTEWIKTFDASKVDMEEFEKYSARNVTKMLVEALEEALNRRVDSY
jgi:hypothetical protein